MNIYRRRLAQTVRFCLKHADHGNGPQFPSTSSVMERERRGRPLYRPLNEEEIRLIEIYPGEWDDPIACPLTDISSSDAHFDKSMTLPCQNLSLSSLLSDGLLCNLDVPNDEVF